MSEKKFPLALIFRAVDKASPVLKTLTDRVNKSTGPLRGFGKAFAGLGDAMNLKGFASIGSAIGGVGSAVIGLGAKFAGVTAAAGLFFGSIIKGAMDAGDRLGENAARVGLSVDAYASLQFAAAQSDVSSEMFASSLDKLNKQMGDMKIGKGGAFLAFLNDLSPSLAKQMKAAKSSEAGLALLTDAFAKIKDPARRASLAAHAFGKSNAQMGEWMRGGSVAIHAQQLEFVRLSGSQERFALGAGDLDNATRRTETAFLGLRSTVSAELFPALTKISDWVTEFLVANRGGIEAWAKKTGKAISDWVDGGGLDRLAASLKDVAREVGQVVDFLGPSGLAAVVGTVTLMPLITSLATLGASLVVVAPQLAAFGSALVWVAGIVAPVLLAFSPLILLLGSIIFLSKRIYDNWDELAFIFKDWGRSLKFAVLDAWAVVKPVLEKIAAVPVLGNFAAAHLAQGTMIEGAITRSLAPAEEGRPPVAGSTQANVSVDFSNMPPGARVSVDPNSSQPVDTSVGYSMAGAF